MILKLTPAFAATVNDAYGGDPGCALGSGIYRHTCPEAEAIIFYWVEQAVAEDSRMAASLLRLHFHDCFVNARHFFCLHTLSFEGSINPTNPVIYC